MSSELKVRALALVTLILAAGGLRWVEGSVREMAPVATVRSEQLAGLAGQGGTLAILGGMRSAVAGGFWLRTNLAWERSDEAATLALIELTVAADERPLYFWLNGARMIAYDMPEWGPDPKGRPAAVRQKIVREQAVRALALLEKGLHWHGPRAEIYVEMANIAWRRLGEVERAASYYRLAAEQPDAPYYAARIYAELLIGLGKEAEALAWLEGVIKTLPEDDPAARRDVVAARIADLQRRGHER